MSYQQWLLVAVALLLIAVGALAGADDQLIWTWSGPVAAGVFLLALLAVAVGCWKIRGTLDRSADAPTMPWADDDAFATPAPERSGRDHSLSSDGFVAVVERAGRAARTTDTVDGGLAVVREPLRETLLEAMAAGGRSRADAEAALERGDWTDDPVAASVLDKAVEPPDRPLRERLRAWLFPERVVRERSRRATAAVADAADDALPTVPGQTAPRTKPVLRPRLEELTRGADGRLQRAVDPMATARGPRPPRARLEGDSAATEADSGTDDGSDADARGRPDSDSSSPSPEVNR